MKIDKNKALAVVAVCAAVNFFLNRSPESAPVPNGQLIEVNTSASALLSGPRKAVAEPISVAAVEPTAVTAVTLPADSLPAEQAREPQSVVESTPPPITEIFVATPTVAEVPTFLPPDFSNLPPARTNSFSSSCSDGSKVFVHVRHGGDLYTIRVNETSLDDLKGLQATFDKKIRVIQEGSKCSTSTSTSTSTSPCLELPKPLLAEVAGSDETKITLHCGDWHLAVPGYECGAFPKHVGKIAITDQLAGACSLGSVVKVQKFGDSKKRSPASLQKFYVTERY